MKRMFLLLGALVLLSAASLTAQEMPEPAPGERLYVGEAKFYNVQKFKIGFLLSADNSAIHHVTIIYSKLEGKYGTVEKGGCEYNANRFPVDSDTIKFFTNYYY